MRVTIVGGDERALWLRELLRERGELVHTLGLTVDDGAACALRDAQVAVLPYPFAVREGRVPCLTGITIEPQSMLRELSEQALLVTGDGLDDYLSRESSARRVLNLSRDEAFLCENAEISAEGTLCYAMRAMDGLLRGASCLVIGYGRFGKEIAWRLHALGATVTVAARREDARQAARGLGMLACPLEKLREVLPGIQVVFNTVPAPVLGAKELRLLPPDALLMEVASKPYGIDLEAANQLALQSLTIGGIPARFAPKAAAEAILRAIRRAMRRDGCE